MTVLGGGAALSGVPITTTPANSVWLSFEDAVNELAVLLDCDLTRFAPIVHPVAVGRTQRPVTCATLDALLSLDPTSPLLSLREAAAVTADPIVTVSRS